MAFSSDFVCWFAARKLLCVYSFYITWPLSKSFECQKCTVIILSLAFCKCKVFHLSAGARGANYRGSALDQNCKAYVWFAWFVTTALNSLAYGDRRWSDRKLLWRWNADQTHVGVCNLWHQSWQPASISLSSRFLSLMNTQTGLHAEEEVFIFIICSPAVCPWVCGAVSDSQKCLIPSAPTLLSFAHSCSCAKTSWMCAQYVVQYFQGLHYSPEPPKLWHADWHGYWGVPSATSKSCVKRKFITGQRIWTDHLWFIQYIT